MEEIDHYQSDEGDLPNETSLRRHQSSTNAGTFTSDTYFVCRVSCISIKRIKYLTRQFYLPAAIIKPGPNDRLYIPLPRMEAFSKEII